MVAGYDILAVQRVNGIMQELRNQREIPQELRFLNTINSVDSTDGEIMGRFKGDVFISDIITEGSVAITKNTDTFSTETYKMPKIKHGVQISEEMISMLARINAGGGVANDQGTLSKYIIRKEDGLLLGIRQRQNALVVAMRLDMFAYSRGGVVINNAAWGMPSDLKLVPYLPWSNPASTPFSDITGFLRYIRQKYGKTYNRIRMSSQCFDFITSTDEFKAKMQLYSQMLFPTGSFPLFGDLGTMLNMVQKLMNLTVELEDDQYWDQASDGSKYTVPFWPANQVELSFTGDDNNDGAAWLGNAVVPETVVSSLADTGGVIGKFSGPEYGPVSYTVGSPTLNPPDLTMWAVAKCWPVRADRALTARITAY